MRSSVPDIPRLFRIFKRANTMGYAVLAVEIVAAVALVLVLDWSYLAENWLVTLIVIGVAGYDIFGGYAILLGQKKKRVEDIGDGVKIGLYSKSSLLDTFRAVQSRMGLPDNSQNLFIVREKSANAAAVRVGFSGFVRSLNAVYINRSILHILPPRELQAVLGHELAHNTAFLMVIRKYGPVHLLASTLIALFILQQFGAATQISLLVIVFVVFGLRWIISMFEGRYSHVVEYLCDQFGARVAGVEAAINALLKIGLLAETHLALQMQILHQNKKQARLSTDEMLKIYEEALPFGAVDKETLLEQIEGIQQTKIKENRSLSIKGFLQYISDREPEELKETLSSLEHRTAMLNRRPKIDWVREFLTTTSHSLSAKHIAELVVEIANRPEAVLFRLPEEIESHASHPSFRNRIISLWQNPNDAKV